MIRVSPSIASCDFLNVKAELSKIENQYEDLHIDIEDGNFTPNITFGMKMVRAIRKATNVPFSVHLMVSDPLPYIEEFCKLNSSIIFIHVETSLYLRRYLNLIHDHGIKAGIALNPISDIRQYLNLIDVADAIMYLTTEQDGKGEMFQPAVISKMRNVPGKEIWVDGGINEETLPMLPEYVTTVVMGRAVFQK
jgi:ribulose-phosphate 3-epimerase